MENNILRLFHEEKIWKYHWDSLNEIYEVIANKKYTALGNYLK